MHHVDYQTNQKTKERLSEISCWTPLKPQHSNPNSNPLANQLWCIDFLTPATPLIIVKKNIFLFRAIQFSQAILFQLIQFCKSTDFVYTQFYVKQFGFV